MHFVLICEAINTQLCCFVIVTLINLTWVDIHAITRSFNHLVRMSRKNINYSPLYVVEWGFPNIIASVRNKRGIVQSSPFAGIDQAKVTADPGSKDTVG